MADRIRIGMVGAGGIARTRHVPGLKALAGRGVELTAVVNSTRASSERAAAEFGFARVHDNWHELVNDPDIDAVVIGATPYLHHPVTLAALSAGKHVLTEARLAMNAQQAREMLQASLNHPQLVTQVVPAPFTIAIDDYITELVQTGYLGELQAVDIRIPSGWLDRDAPYSFRTDRAQSGVNIMLLGIFYEHLLLWAGHATAVTARTRLAVPYRLDPSSGRRLPVSVPDHVEVIADLPNGALARIHMSGVAGLMPGPEAWLFGSDATLKIEGQGGGRLFGAHKGAKELEPLTIPQEKLGGWRVETEFVNAIHGEEKVRRTTFELGVRYMEFTEAVHISAREGRTVSLPLM